MIDDISPAELVRLISLPVALYLRPQLPLSSVTVSSPSRMLGSLDSSDHHSPWFSPVPSPSPARGCSLVSSHRLQHLSPNTPPLILVARVVALSHRCMQSAPSPAVGFVASHVSHGRCTVPSATLSELSSREQDPGGDEQAGPGNRHGHGDGHRPAAGGRDGIWKGRIYDDGERLFPRKFAKA
jgi:hypothetical protein